MSSHKKTSIAKSEFLRAHTGAVTESLGQAPDELPHLN